MVPRFCGKVWTLLKFFFPLPEARVTSPQRPFYFVVGQGVNVVYQGVLCLLETSNTVPHSHLSPQNDFINRTYRAGFLACNWSLVLNLMYQGGVEAY